MIILSSDNLSAECFLNYLLENYVFLNFDLLRVRSLNFPKISASFFIIRDCVYNFFLGAFPRNNGCDEYGDS